MKLLNTQSLSYVQSIIKDYLIKYTKTKIIKIEESYGYILAQDIYSIENIPAFNKSQVDGYALNNKDTNGATNAMPSILTLRNESPIGLHNETTLLSNEAQYISTGAMVPSNANAIVMIEDVEVIEATKQVLIYQNSANNENIILQGEDIQKDSLLFETNTFISERIISVLASLGITQILVYQPLKVAIISSGNELVSYQEKSLPIGKVRDVNSIMLEQLLSHHKFEIIYKELISDDYQIYLDTLSNIEADLYITSAGSSKGKEDYTALIFEELTNNLLVHGINVKPGKPTIIAQKENKLYLGLPGNPVAAYLVLSQCLIKSYKEIYNQTDNVSNVRISENINSDHGKDTLILVKFTELNNEMRATPLYYKSSQLISLAGADGYLLVPYNKEGYQKDELVKVVLL